jgi:hypothetical protein
MTRAAAQIAVPVGVRSPFVGRTVSSTGQGYGVR